MRRGWQGVHTHNPIFEERIYVFEKLRFAFRFCFLFLILLCSAFIGSR